jgi:NAD(P)-dependent dehydrogenase (short-subunit alcohol dehydrogenase family)
MDGLVNSAGVARFASLTDADDDDVRRLFEVNFMAIFRLIRACADQLRAARGSVVNVTSIGGMVAMPHRSAYGAIKAAANHLTRSLARELAPDVRVNAVAPGAVDTPIYADLGLGPAARASLREQMVCTTPLGRMGTGSEVASWICQLLDPRSSWVTGSIVVVDGGRSC